MDLSDLYIGAAKIHDADDRMKHFISRRVGPLTSHVAGVDASNDPWLPHEFRLAFVDSVQALHEH